MNKLFPAIMIALCVAIGGTVGTTHAATHYVLGYSSVDSGKGLEWGGSTAYATEWNSSIATWNARGKVTISADTMFTLQDLTVSDAYSPAASWAGVYTYKGAWSAETLQFNTYYLDRFSSAQKQNVATHELGHSLGLAHSTAGMVMYKYVSTVTALGAQDTGDYTYLYP